MLKRLIRSNRTAEATQPGANRRTMEPSVIASNMNILGNVVSDGPLDIDGQIDGNVRGNSVTLRVNGRIRGDLIAEDVYVHGTVDGIIKARNVTLYATAHIRGTVMHESITVEDGASVDGKLKRTERIALEEMRVESARRVVMPMLESSLDSDNDNDDATTSEDEMKILEHLRLIS